MPSHKSMYCLSASKTISSTESTSPGCREMGDLLSCGSCTVLTEHKLLHQFGSTSLSCAWHGYWFKLGLCCFTKQGYNQTSSEGSLSASERVTTADTNTNAVSEAKSFRCAGKGVYASMP